MVRVKKQVIALNIKNALKENKTNQSELAKVLGKSRAYVSNIVKGRYTPRIEELYKIADYLNKPFCYFFGEDSPELSEYAEKAKKWDEVVNMFSEHLKTKGNEPYVSLPYFNFDYLFKEKIKSLDILIKNSPNFLYITKYLLQKHLKYIKPFNKLVAIRNTNEFPSFGLLKDDIGIYEPIENNDISDFKGKVFLVNYKNEYGLKRIYFQDHSYYFEPLNTSPEIDKLKISDKDLTIIGRLVFVIHIKVF